MSSFECANHPGADAAWMCVGCEGVFCGECISRKQFGHTLVETCKACGELCNAVRAGVAVEEQRLSETLAGAFTYPLRDAGPTMILGGALFAAVVQFLAFGFGTLMVWGIFLGYGMSIIASTAEGREKAPNWPDVATLPEIGKPIVLAWATVALSFYPAWWAQGAERPRLALGLMVAGALYAPMAWIAASVSRNFLAITPITVLPLLFKVNASYWLACGVLLAVGVVGRVGMAALEAVLPAFLGTGIVSAAALYLLMVEMRILGLVWRANEDELGLA